MDVVTDPGMKVVKEITLGAPEKKSELSKADVCCLLAKDGWVNPSREEMIRRGSFAVHHWVHTWLDGPDARWGRGGKRTNACVPFTIHARLLFKKKNHKK